MKTGSNDTTGTPGARGREAEDLAARYLECRGLRVVDRNFRIRGGEIDLVCRHGDTLVFVEVRLRSRGDFGGAGASITATKRRRIILAARHYLARRPRQARNWNCRFDCVLLAGLDEASIEWIPGAFSVDD